MSKELIIKAINIAGGYGYGRYRRAAAKIGITEENLAKMRREGIVPGKHCRKFERATGGAVTAEELRPDIFAPVERK